ncbi:MAG: hypothetical protein R3B07_13630 [Polyangiaceae bacterium]
MTDVSSPQSEPIEVTLEKLKQFLLAPIAERPERPDIPWPPRVEMLNEHGDPLEMICQAQATRVLLSAVTDANTAVILVEDSPAMTRG